MVLSGPFFRCKFVGFLELFLIREAGIGVEVISPKSIGRNQHGLGTLHVGVELSALEERGQDSPAFGHVTIHSANGISALPVIGGSRLRSQRVDVVKFASSRKNADVGGKQVLW